MIYCSIHNGVYGIKKVKETFLLESFNTLYGLLLLFLGGKVNIKNLDTILNNLEIKLADSELKDLTQNIHADGKYVIRYGSYHEASLVENYWVYI